ncbi:MAG: hypothetical protein RL059_1037, partial [Bacteroidota bacterium]
MSRSLVATSQTSKFNDTISIIDSSISDIILYSSNDSIYNDLVGKKVHLYGNAKVEMGDIKLTAGYILIDLNANEVQASYRIGENGEKIELPAFSDGQESIVCLRMR